MIALDEVSVKEDSPWVSYEVLGNFSWAGSIAKRKTNMDDDVDSRLEDIWVRIKALCEAAEGPYLAVAPTSRATPGSSTSTTS